MLKSQNNGGSVNDFRSEQYVKRIKRKHGSKNGNVVFVLRILIILFSIS